jgi:hypothetical protein
MKKIEIGQLPIVQGVDMVRVINTKTKQEFPNKVLPDKPVGALFPMPLLYQVVEYTTITHEKIGCVFNIYI